mmetsp:Transcript_126298/g.351904  ORF Transcript_126298/g.351904 Transcript_126298/m.351904 type:complete len:342 (-) Transcript_126298:278-1303(-)
MGRSGSASGRRLPPSRGYRSCSHADATACAAVQRSRTLGQSRPRIVASRGPLTPSVSCMARTSPCGEPRSSSRLRGSAGSLGDGSSLHWRSFGRKFKPHNISSRRTPTDQTSAFLASKSASIRAITSGAMNCTVPTYSQGASSPCAPPKSTRTTETSGWLERTTTFSCLMSRCTMPRAWQWWMAPATCWCTCRASAGVKTLPVRACWYSHRFRMPAKSMRSRTESSVCAASCRRTTLGWSNCWRIWTSRKRPATFSGWPWSVLSLSTTFRAKFLLFPWSRTKNTVPWAPTPRAVPSWRRGSQVAFGSCSSLPQRAPPARRCELQRAAPSLRKSLAHRCSPC